MNLLFRFLVIPLLIALVSCDYEMKDFPDKVEGHSYDLAIPVVNGKYEMKDFKVNIPGLGEKNLSDIPDYILIPEFNIKHEFSTDSFISKDFDENNPITIQGLTTHVNWSDTDLPDGLSIHIWVAGKYDNGKEVYIIGKDELKFESGVPKIDDIEIKDASILNLLSEVENLKIGFEVKIAENIKASELSKAIAEIKVGMRIQFYVEKL